MNVTACLYCGEKKLTFVTHRVDNVDILKCAKCGLMMVAKLSDDTEKLYTAEYFEKQEGTKNGYTNYLSSPVANLIGKYAFTRMITDKPGKHLDLGSADGSLMEIFTSEKFTSIGLEISKDAVSIAKAKGLDVRFSNLHSFPANLPKSNVITAFDLLEHADNPGLVLREVFKNLENNGYFVFSTLSVKKNDPSDYWFNNSLEHYIYYNKSNLTYILTDIFGANNFSFTEFEINGIAEFWGFAKKGTMRDEKKIIDQLNKNTYDKKDPHNGFLLSLFYDQLAKFDESEKIIQNFELTWSAGTSAQAKFYHQYFQGKYENAVNDAEKNINMVSVNKAIYWQALDNARKELFTIKNQDTTNIIINLRSQVFGLKSELHTLHNSRLLGRIIKARETVGESRKKIKQIPQRSIHKVRVLVAPAFPRPVRLTLKKIYKQTKHTAHNNPIKYITTENRTWNNGIPLVSVVIPYYNRADTIDETLSSLNNQTFRNFEIILVNDGSTDSASIKKLREIKTLNKTIIIVDKINGGVATARNSGIQIARGKYIVCLDSDDILEPTYLEKCTLVLESNPDISLVTTHKNMFGVVNERYDNAKYDPIELIQDNMVITAAEFKKEAWLVSKGYKSGIGYEDWEFWITLSEYGFFGMLIPETLFRYRTAIESRYIADKDTHWRTIKDIRNLHPGHKKIIRMLLKKNGNIKHLVNPKTAFINTCGSDMYKKNNNSKVNVLIAIPWMTFGGAETLIVNFCNEIKDKFNLSFVTGLASSHEWEYKFIEITENVYHLNNLFKDDKLYIEFISNYITTRDINVLHIIHTSFVFEMLPELKKRHPNLKVIVTVFNDRAEHFENSVMMEEYIDTFTTDNSKVANLYRQKILKSKTVTVIPNGINSLNVFTPAVVDRQTERNQLGIKTNELAVFFIGRLSEEKNPDVFLKVANKIISNRKENNIKFFIIGDGVMRPEIEKTISDINSPNIKYLGYQSEVARYLSAADIFVLPSSVEGFPLSILEAMAMKVAVISSDVGAVSEVLEKDVDGFIVTPGSVNEIKDAILYLNNDRKQLDIFKQKSRRKVEAKYSNTILGQNYVKLYRDTLK